MGRSDHCFPNGLIKCECDVSTFQVKHTKIQLGSPRRPRYRHFPRKGFGVREVDVFLERVLVKLLPLWSPLPAQQESVHTVLTLPTSCALP